MSMTFKTLQNILEHYPSRPEYLIGALQDVQARFNYIPLEAMMAVCDYLRVPLSQGWAVATFFKSFTLEPRGEHVIKVCLGTACHLKGGQRLVESLERDLRVERGHSTADLRFTLETVNCVGACALAPLAVVDEEYHPKTNSRKIKKYLKTAAAK
jgi:NADH-quinone oxidoreductase subunit E